MGLPSNVRGRGYRGVGRNTLPPSPPTTRGLSTDHPLVGSDLLPVGGLGGGDPLGFLYSFKLKKVNILLINNFTNKNFAGEIFGKKP
jgi:hypothetical protein